MASEELLSQLSLGMVSWCLTVILAHFASILSDIYLCGSGSNKLLNADLIRIRIHSSGCRFTFFKFQLGNFSVAIYHYFTCPFVSIWCFVGQAWDWPDDVDNERGAAGHFLCRAEAPARVPPPGTYKTKLGAVYSLWSASQPSWSRPNFSDRQDLLV